MRIQLTKANAFQIEPGKKYVVLITNKDGMLTQEDEDRLKKQLEPLGMTVAVLPQGTKYKLVETSPEGEL